MKTLQILIPTFNRSSHLKKNILNLSEIIKKSNLSNQVSIIISNNGSTDDTKKVLDSFDLSNVIIFNQEYNIGLENNALFCLSKSSADYVMFLGDDDYLDENYLKFVLLEIDTNKELSLIVPSCRSINLRGDVIEGGRDLNINECRFKSSMKAAVYFATRGCQMSGVVHKNKKLFKKYIEDGVSNIYPFVYFTTYSALTGESIHFTNYPVLITQPGQENKTWNYGNDGLLDQIFNNFRCLSVIGYLDRCLLEQEILKTDRWRWIMSLKNNPLRLLISIATSKNTSIFSKLSYPILIVKYSIGKVINNVRRE